jgi:hypothetical protein
MIEEAPIIIPAQEPPYVLVPIPVAPLAGKEVRRSIRLKAKGMVGSSSGAGSSRTNSLSGTYPLLTNFPFTRLSTEEVLELFRSYRIILGENETQRDMILKSLQNSSRDTFLNSVSQMIEKTIENSFDLITMYPS